MSVCQDLTHKYKIDLQSASKKVDTSCLNSPIYVQINTPVSTPLLITKPPPPPSLIQCCLYMAKSSWNHHTTLLFLGGGEGWGRGKWISLTQAKDIKLKSQGVEKVNMSTILPPIVIHHLLTRKTHSLLGSWWTGVYHWTGMV